MNLLQEKNKPDTSLVYSWKTGTFLSLKCHCLCISCWLQPNRKTSLLHIRQQCHLKFKMLRMRTLRMNRLPALSYFCSFLLSPLQSSKRSRPRLADILSRSWPWRRSSSSLLEQKENETLSEGITERKRSENRTCEQQLNWHQAHLQICSLSFWSWLNQQV